MRLLKSVDRKLDDVVTKDMFTAESRRVDDKLASLGEDIADERAARTREIAEEQGAREKAILAERHAREAAWKEQKERADKQASNVRWLAATILLPIALFLIERFGGT